MLGFTLFNPTYLLRVKNMRIVYRISAKGIIEVVAPGLRKTIYEEL